ncbi:FtsH protease activity modulator HflK [Luteimonas sp. e5]
MAWNKPGNGNHEPPTPRGRGPRGGGPLDGVLEQMRGLFDGGNPLRWIPLAIALWLAYSSFVLVGEQQRGVVLRLGQFARVMQPGPNFKLPWPVETVTKIDATTVQSYTNTVPVLTRDENIVNVSFNVQYRVGDPRLYLYGTQGAREMLEQIAISTVREQIGRANLDTALNARGPLSSAAQNALQASLDAYRTGLVVTEVNLQDARPPEEVKPAFDEVNSAQQMNERLINEARAYAAKIVPEARGEAARILAGAEGHKTAAIARATGDAERFNLLVGAYQSAPEVTRKRLWLETLEQVLGENRKVVGGDGRQLIYVPMSGQGTAAAGPSAQLPLAPPQVVAPEADIPAANDARAPRPGREPRQ